MMKLAKQSEKCYTDKTGGNLTPEAIGYKGRRFYF